MKTELLLLLLLLLLPAARSADRGWQLVAQRDAVARMDGRGSVHVETRSEDAVARLARNLKVPDDAREVRVQVDWRPHAPGKAANVFTLASWDANQALVKIRSVGGRNRLSYSTGRGKAAEIKQTYRVGHWHRIIVRVTRGVYHLAVIDRGPENLRDFRVVFDSQEDRRTPPGLANVDIPLKRFYASAFPNQGKSGYSFELANFDYSLR